MRFEIITDPAEFRAKATPLLIDEARHNLILGILAGVEADPSAYDNVRLMLVANQGQAVSVAVANEPYRLVVADTPDDAALSELIFGVVAHGVEAPGVLANRPTVDRFVRLWEEATGGAAVLAMAQGVFALSEVLPLEPSPGTARTIMEKDVETVFHWVNAFREEALPGEPRDDGRLSRLIQQRLEPDSEARVWLWDLDGRPVSMSWNSRRIGAGVRVNLVYTPPEHRGNGYATALVAAQAEWLLSHGVELCSLFTDLANPTSNKIYESVGYRLVAEAASYDFNPAT